MLKDYNLYSGNLKDLPTSTLLITTLNAHSYNVARKDKAFAEALLGSDVLIPDGVSVVWAAKLLAPQPPKGDLRKESATNLHSQQDRNVRKIKKIAGEDLFYYEMKRLDKQPPNPQMEKKDKSRAFFLGSTEEVLAKIKARAAKEFPCIEVHTYSPPYKAEFSAEDNAAMVAAINAVNPNVLFVGMTAPKQEKWAYQLMNNEQLIMNNEDKHTLINNEELKINNEDGKINNEQLISDNEEKLTYKIGEKELSIINYQLSITNCHICCIGAVFDFYAGTVKRAPKWIINLGMEWFYRLVSEPKRMWKRYLVGNVKFVWYVLREKFNNK